MAQQPETTGASEKPSPLRRAAAAAGALASWVLARPRRRAPLVAAPLVLTVGAGIAWAAFRPGPLPPPTLDELMAALDGHEFDEAQALAERWLETSPTGRAPQGLVLYVRGRRADHEAHASSDPDARPLHRLAAGLLQQSLDQGLPAELWDQAVVQAAENLNRSHRYAASVRLLESRLEAELPAGPQVNRLLAEAYARLPDPQWEKALVHLDRCLAAQDVSAAERKTAGLARAEILLGLGRDEAVQAALAPVVKDRSSAPAAALVLQARWLVREATRNRAQAPDASSKSAELLQQALGLVEEVKRREALDRPERQQADYLYGVCLRDAGKSAEALQVFSAVRRLHYGNPSGLAAALAEAELLQHEGRDEESLAAFRRLLAEAPLPVEYSSQWMSLEGFRTRLMAAYARWLSQQQYDQALALAAALPPLFPQARAMGLQAEARVEWARRLQAESQAAPAGKQPGLAAAARKQHRLAGVAYARLALLRPASREYPDDIWRSAENYLRGQDYRHASRMFRLYLDHEVRPRRIDAQVFLAEALVSLGDLDAALEVLESAMATDPRHPANYRARLLAAQARLEQGKLEDAKRLLRDNLEDEDLAPRSLEWQDSLFLLGEALYREGTAHQQESRKPTREELQQCYQACREAADRLDEALQRFPDAPQALRGWYFLAESHRHAAWCSRQRLASLEVRELQIALERDMQASLAQAIAAYEQLIERLPGEQPSDAAAALPERRLSKLEAAMLRNACFGQAHALFDLGRYDEALQVYTLAARRYQNEPAALEALVQIASCHRRLGRIAEAKGALEKAKAALERTAPEADLEGGAHYGRKHWEELLGLLTAAWR